MQTRKKFFCLIGWFKQQIRGGGADGNINFKQRAA
jgi:hypothetical protein